MASEKQYAYYIEGNQICIVERDLTFDNNVESKEFGPGVARRMWKSPITAITDGLELKYTYSPQYRMYGNGATNLNKFFVNGWTVIGGYLTFVRGSLAASEVDWTASPYSAVTSGTSGDTGGQTGLDYIVVKGSSRWNGLHRVQTAGTEGQLVTYTKVSEGLPYWENQQVDFNDNGTVFDGGGGSLHLASHFSAGDFIYISGCSTLLNNGLHSVVSVSKDNTAADSTITLGDRYTCLIASIAGTNDIDSEYSAAENLGDDDDESDINLYKAYHDFCYLRTDIDVLNDENDEIDLPSYLTKGLVYYIKARLAEDTGNIEAKEYFMKEYKKILERHESSKIGGVRIIGPGSHAIR